MTEERNLPDIREEFMMLSCVFGERLLFSSLLTADHRDEAGVETDFCSSGGSGEMQTPGTGDFPKISSKALDFFSDFEELLFLRSSRWCRCFLCRDEELL